MPTGGDLSGRVLILAPIGRDAELLAHALEPREIAALVCPDVDAFAQAFAAGCGAALLTEEALYADRLFVLREAVAAQPTWSEVPFIVLTSRGQADERVRLTLDLMAPLRSATVIERPVRPGTIVTAIEGALRDRARQYGVRDAMEALRTSETRLASVLGSINDGFYALDREERFTLFNDECERYFGIPRERVLGRSYFEVLPQVRRSEIEARFEAAFSTGEAQHFEVRSPVTGRLVAMHLYPSPTGLTVLFTDITERDATRTALAESQRQLALAQQAGRVGSFSWDIPSDRVIWSPEIEALYGVPEGTFEGSFHDWRRRVVPEDAARVESDLGAALEAHRAEFDYEFRAILPNGEWRWFEGQSRFEYDAAGAPLLMRGVNVDIDARKRAEEALRGTNENLERQVAARTADLVSKIGELEGFCYSVSHDMRTPLRAIVSNATLVLEDEGDAVSEEGQERLRRLSTASLKMARLIDDLLQYARLGGSEPRREPCDLTEMARRIADEALLDRPGLDARIDVAPEMRGSCDSRLVGLVLHNLVDNALKYQPAGVTVRIEIGQDPDGAFFVRDNGIGFDMAYASKIFRPFERLHRDGDYAGTGIGLANAQRIIENHGGRIWAEGHLGEGATFRFTLG